MLNWLVAQLFNVEKPVDDWLFYVVQLCQVWMVRSSPPNHN